MPLARRDHYYLIRVYKDDGSELCTRCEKASGPRQACQKAFGVVYDRPTDTCRYLDLGTRKPAYLSEKAKRALVNDPANWKRIPPREKEPTVLPKLSTKGLTKPEPETPHEPVDGCD